MLISFDRVSKTEHPKQEDTLSPTRIKHSIPKSANPSEGNCPNWLHIPKKLFRVPVRIFKGKIRYWSLPQIIINYCIIMTNKHYNYIINAQCNYYISSRNAIKCGSNCGCYYFLCKKKERDGTRAETRFRLSPKRTSPFKSVGASVQSTAGSRGVRISLSNAG